MVFFFSGDSFTLEKIIELGLDQNSEQISEISGAASKELSIEQVRIVHAQFDQNDPCSLSCFCLKKMWSKMVRSVSTSYYDNYDYNTVETHIKRSTGCC